MRRRLLLAILAVPPISIAALIHGCSTEPPFESACQWISDPENCFREFREDMLATKTTLNPFGDCRSPRGDAGPTEANADPANLAGVSNGQFLMRSSLDKCILAGGGQVVFDPPIDLTMFPPSPLAAPTTYKIKFLEPTGDECGFATYTSPHGFAITIDTPPGIDAGALEAGKDDDDGGAFIPYGTYTQVIPPGRDAFDVTCPSGETHHLNLDEIEGPIGDGGVPTSGCPGFAPLLPSASLQIYPGGIDTAGGVSLAIVFPPTLDSPPGSPDGYPDASDQQKVPLQTPDRVIYFNCAVPAAPEQCVDGVKNGGETDVDCGGIQVPSKTLDGGVCPVRCAMGQQCIVDSDCDGLQCLVDAMSGMRKCGGTPTTPPPATPDAGGDGG